MGECEVALAWLLFATLSRCHTNETQKLLRLKGDDAAASINECRPFRALCPYAVINAITPNPLLPFRSFQTFRVYSSFPFFSFFPPPPPSEKRDPRGTTRP